MGSRLTSHLRNPWQEHPDINLHTASLYHVTVPRSWVPPEMGYSGHTTAAARKTSLDSLVFQALGNLPLGFCSSSGKPDNQGTHAWTVLHTQATQLLPHNPDPKRLRWPSVSGQLHFRGIMTLPDYLKTLGLPRVPLDPVKTQNKVQTFYDFQVLNLLLSVLRETRKISSFTETFNKPRKNLGN